MEPYSTLVNETLINLSETLKHYHHPFSKQEDGEVEKEFHNMANDLSEEDDEADQSEGIGPENGLICQFLHQFR